MCTNFTYMYYLYLYFTKKKISKKIYIIYIIDIFILCILDTDTFNFYAGYK